MDDTKVIEVVSLYDLLRLNESIDKAKRKKIKSEIEKIFSLFSCKKNKDVELFLKEKAILFEISDVSRTVLLFVDVNLVGYYTTAYKPFTIDENLSKKDKKKIRGKYFGSSIKEMPSILIGQAAKNERHLNLLPKNFLINHVLEKVKNDSISIAAKIVYLECNDCEELSKYYETFGFEVLVDNNGNKVMNDNLLIMFMNIQDIVLNDI